MPEQKLFFNSSLPRSGSTLMQNILAQNPRFHCTPTSGVSHLLYHMRKQFTENTEFKFLDPDDARRMFLAFCKNGMQGWYRELTDKPVVMDKSREWHHFYEWLASFMPDPKFIVCIRDIRGICSSMEKLYRKNRHLHDPDDDSHALTMLTVPNRIGKWLASVPLGSSVLRLLDAVQRNTIQYLHVVRFEDLTANPDAVMKKVYDYLGEPFFQHDFEHIAQVTHEIDALYPYYANHNIRESVKPVPLDFREVLGKELSAQIVQRFVTFYQTFYPGVVPTTPTPPAHAAPPIRAPR